MQGCTSRTITFIATQYVTVCLSRRIHVLRRLHILRRLHDMRQFGALQFETGGAPDKTLQNQGGVEKVNCNALHILCAFYIRDD